MNESINQSFYGENISNITAHGRYKLTGAQVVAHQ